MTEQEYKKMIRAFGLTPAKPSFDGATIHQDRDGHFVRIIDADQMLPDEREAFLGLLQVRHGYTQPH